jgi:hypothetical protein
MTMHDVNSTCRQNKLHHEHSAWYLKLIEPFEWRDDPNLVWHDARSARVSCFLVFSFGATRLAASSSCSLLNNHWSLCTPKAHIYLKVILVQLNSWESRCLSLPLVAISTNWQRWGRHSIVRDGTIFYFSEPLLLPHLPLYYKECLEAHKDVHHMTRRITFRWAPRRCWRSHRGHLSIWN